MLNTFVVRKNAIIQTLDDLVIVESRAQYGISKADPAIWANDLTEMSGYIREVTADYRSALQRVDDEIEALMNRREDLRNQAFGQGQDINAAELEAYLK